MGAASQTQLDSAASAQLEDIEKMLINKNQLVSKYGEDQHDGLYFDDTLDTHEAVAPQNPHLKNQDIAILRRPDNKAPVFVRFGPYAIVDQSLKEFIPAHLHKNVLFLSSFNRQFGLSRRGFEYALPYLAQMYRARAEFKGKTVLELGLGGGVAALFALTLGAQKVVGVERDGRLKPLFDADRKLNGIDATQAVFIQGHFADLDTGEKLKSQGPFDVVIENIGPQPTYLDDADPDKKTLIYLGLAIDGSNL